MDDFNANVNAMSKVEKRKMEAAVNFNEDCMMLGEKLATRWDLVEDLCELFDVEMWEVEGNGMVEGKGNRKGKGKGKTRDKVVFDELSFCSYKTLKSRLDTMYLMDGGGKIPPNCGTVKACKEAIRAMEAHIRTSYQTGVKNRDYGQQWEEEDFGFEGDENDESDEFLWGNY